MRRIGASNTSNYGHRCKYLIIGISQSRFKTLERISRKIFYVLKKGVNIELRKAHYKKYFYIFFIDA